MWREIEGKILGREGGEGRHPGLECRTFLRQDCPPGAPGVGVALAASLLFPKSRPSGSPLGSATPSRCFHSGLLLKDGVRLHSLSFLYLERFYFFRLFPSIFKEFFQMRDGGLPTSALTAAGEAGQRELPPRGGLWGRGVVTASQDHQQALIVTGGGGTLDSGIRWTAPSPLSWCSGGHGTPCV